MTRIRQAVVLAGGRGTRLGDATKDVPKPLLDVGGRPFLEWVLEHWVSQGLEQFIVTTGYQAESFEQWRASTPIGARIETHVEEEPLDTGGALTLLRDRLDDWVLVLNGDTLFDVELGAMVHRLGRPDTDAVLALRQVPDTARYGRVEVAEGLIRAFDEKGVFGPGLINGGVYLIRSEALGGHAAPLSLERAWLPDLVQAGRVLGATWDGFFIDIGVPPELARAQAAVPAWWEAREAGG